MAGERLPAFELRRDVAEDVLRDWLFITYQLTRYFGMDSSWVVSGETCQEPLSMVLVILFNPDPFDLRVFTLAPNRTDR